MCSTRFNGSFRRKLKFSIQHFPGGGGGGEGVAPLIPYKNAYSLWTIRGWVWTACPPAPSGSTPFSNFSDVFIQRQISQDVHPILSEYLLFSWGKLGSLATNWCACHFLWTLSSNYFLSHIFYELVIQFQVDICILIPFWCLQTFAPEFGPESGAFETVGQFVLSVTMTWRHLHFKWRNELTAECLFWFRFHKF